MARIVYGVAGEGFGHSSRSHLIGKRLIDAGHDVMFAGSNKSLEYLKLYFGDRVKEVFGLTFEYEHGKINAFATIKKNLRRFYADELNRQLFKEHIEPFSPDLVITDFEPFTAWWAIRNKVPYISIDNEHILTHCKLESIKGQFLAHFNAWFVTRSYYFCPKAYVIISFFNAPVKSKNVYLVPPAVRPVLEQFAASAGDYILVYSTIDGGLEKLLDVFNNKFKQYKFILYGFNQARQAGNCTLKERSTEGFITDLAHCRGVIASAGLSLISECLYFKKKMLLLPIPGQYEQVLNAYYVQKLGLGFAAADVDEQSLSAFLAELEKPMPNDDRILWASNEKFFESLRPIFNKLPMPISL